MAVGGKHLRHLLSKIYENFQLTACCQRNNQQRNLEQDIHFDSTQFLFEEIKLYSNLSKLHTTRSLVGI
jgi:hypothetical protein